MSQHSYKDALKNARNELADLLSQREASDKLIAQRRQIIASLSQALGEEAEPKKGYDLFEMSFTKSVVEVIKAANRPLRPVEVKQGLLIRGYNPKTYKNFMSSLHKILQRLEVDGSIEETELEGKKAYQSKSKQ